MKRRFTAINVLVVLAVGAACYWAAGQEADMATTVILGATALGTLAVIVHGFVQGSRVNRAIESLEEALLQAAHGEQVKAIAATNEVREFEGLAYRVEQLVRSAAENDDY